MINRRLHKRVSISGSATLHLQKRGRIQSIQTMIANISLQGIGLYSYSTIPAETPVSLTITFFSSDGGVKRDSVRGRVVTNRKIGKTHIVGIQFEKALNAEDQPALFRHVWNILPSD